MSLKPYESGFVINDFWNKLINGLFKTSVILKQKPVNWFALPISLLASVWKEHLSNELNNSFSNIFEFLLKNLINFVV